MTFYDKRLLNVRTGRFRIIWIAATKVSLLKRKDVLSVDLREKCEDIKNHVIIRRQYPIPGQAPTRFSLYLSSQLVYGAVRILSKQTDYLLEDAASFMSRLKRALARKSSIDLLKNINPEHVTLPDPVSSPNLRQYYYIEGLLDNFHDEYPHIEMDNYSQELLRGTSLEESGLRVSSLSSSIQKLRSGDFLGSPHTVSNLEEITIAAPHSMASGVETLAAIQEDLLPEFGVPYEDLHSSSPISHVLSDIPIVPSEGSPIYRTGFADTSPLPPPVDITPVDMVPTVSQDVLEQEPPVASYVQLEKRQRKRKSRKLVLGEIDPDLERRPAKRCRGLIVDKNIKLSTQTLKKNLEHGSKTSEPGVVKRAVADARFRRAADLLKTPGIALSTALCPLFKRNCKLPPTIFLTDTESSSPTSLMIKTDDSSVLQSSPAPLSTVQTLPIVHTSLSPSIHLPTTKALSPIPPTSPSFHKSSTQSVLLTAPSPTSVPVSPTVHAFPTVPESPKLAGTQVEPILSRASVSPARTVLSLLPSSTTKQRSTPEHSVVEKDGFSVLHSIREEESLMTEDDITVGESHGESTSDVSFSKMVEDNLIENSWTTFRTLVPTTVSRPQAAKSFTRLLELAGRQRVSLTQEEAFGEIYINRYEAV